MLNMWWCIPVSGSEVPPEKAAKPLHSVLPCRFPPAAGGRNIYSFLRLAFSRPRGNILLRLWSGHGKCGSIDHSRNAPRGTRLDVKPTRRCSNQSKHDGGLRHRTRQGKESPNPKAGAQEAVASDGNADLQTPRSIDGERELCRARARSRRQTAEAVCGLSPRMWQGAESNNQPVSKASGSNGQPVNKASGFGTRAERASPRRNTHTTRRTADAGGPVSRAQWCSAAASSASPNDGQASTSGPESLAGVPDAEAVVGTDRGDLAEKHAAWRVCGRVAPNLPPGRLRRA